MTDFWVTAGLATIISLSVSGVVTLWSGYRTLRQQVVIEERRRWRDDLRRLIPSLVSPEQGDVRSVTRNEVFLRLNPVEDQEAMTLIDDYLSDPSPEKGERVVSHFQKYLKFEWTRAKKEADWWPWCAAERARKEISKQELKMARAKSRNGEESNDVD